LVWNIEQVRGASLEKSVYSQVIDSQKKHTGFSTCAEAFAAVTTKLGSSIRNLRHDGKKTLIYSQGRF